MYLKHRSHTHKVALCPAPGVRPSPPARRSDVRPNVWNAERGTPGILLAVEADWCPFALGVPVSSRSDSDRGYGEKYLDRVSVRMASTHTFPTRLGLHEKNSGALGGSSTPETPHVRFLFKRLSQIRDLLGHHEHGVAQRRLGEALGTLRSKESPGRETKTVQPRAPATIAPDSSERRMPRLPTRRISAANA